MKRYRFIYRDKEGRKKDILASSRLHAWTLLLAQGIPITSLQLAFFSFNWKIFFTKKPSHHEFTIFLKQFTTLLSVNLPLLSSLFFLKESHPKLIFRTLSQSIYDDLNQGCLLSQALQPYANLLGQSTLSLIKMAENSGTLLAVLTHIVQQREQRDNLAKKIKQALRYPLLLLLFSLLMVNGLIIAVIPQFSHLYSQMGNTLPASTQNLLAFSQWVHQYGMIIGISSLLGVGGIIGGLRQFPSWQHFLQRLLYYCPILNHLVKQHLHARLLHCLAVSLSAYSPLLIALTHAKEASQHIVFEAKLDKVMINIQQGATLYEAFQQAHCFDSHIRHLIRLGEESGQLAEIFTQLARLSQQKMEDTLNLISQWMEPAMMLIIGSLIGFILISLYGPILSLGQQLG